MTTARQIISDALTFGLNRLSPGETLDSDLAGVCLSALNSVADEVNGSKSFLFREILTVSGTISVVSAALGTDWTGIVAGDDINEIFSSKASGATIKGTIIAVNNDDEVILTEQAQGITSVQLNNGLYDGAFIASMEKPVVVVAAADTVQGDPDDALFQLDAA